jgi:trimethylamine-N-oxide reductase (cytochrome c)
VSKLKLKRIPISAKSFLKNKRREEEWGMADNEFTVVKGMSGGGVTEDSNMIQVDVKDGKILRIRPFHYDWKYDRKPWTMEARGKTFTASMKALIPPFTLAYKNRVHSPNRTMYPLKRVDWDPNGERNPQNRGKSKYQRISGMKPGYYCQRDQASHQEIWPVCDISSS